MYFKTPQITVAFAGQEQKEYASAGAVAEEVLSSIRTVVAFVGEHKEAKRCMRQYINTSYLT